MLSEVDELKLKIKKLEKALVKAEKLEKFCKKWIDKMEISCSESIYQLDYVEEESLPFIEEICKRVGYFKHEDE